MASQDFRDLEVWKVAVEFAVDVYRLSRTFPADERFGLTSQLQRAAVSVSANIAEGQARLHRGDFVHHLSIARGSLAETHTLTTLALRLEYLSQADADGLGATNDRLRRMLHGLLASMSGEQRMFQQQRRPNP